jgi:excisionase family DNA binding protein
MPERRAFVTIADAADYLGVTTRTIRQMIADGRLRGYRSIAPGKSGSRLVRLRLDEIDAAMVAYGGSVA